LSLKCESCHNEQNWRDAPYDHAKAQFPLTGAHRDLACARCHATPAFRDTLKTCAACHRGADAHKGRFSARCESCHNTRSWKSWDFSHDRRTRFKLDGAHRSTRCESCHTKAAEDKLATPRTCVGCHRRDDLHGGGFGQSCDRCHTTQSFKDIKPLR
jgi:hypothetical protein